MSEHEQRPRGILTQADRKYLQGEKELTGQSARNTRRRIRNRLYHALLDFSVLWSYLEERDLELIFQAEGDKKRSAVRTSTQDAISLLILGLWENDDNYRDRITFAIEQAAYARDRSVSVDLDIREELMDSPNEILRRMMDSGFKHISYNEFEKALTHPESSPRLLKQVMSQLEPDQELPLDDVKELQEARENWPVVRPSLPYLISQEPAFEDPESEDCQID